MKITLAQKLLAELKLSKTFDFPKDSNALSFEDGSILYEKFALYIWKKHNKI